MLEAQEHLQMFALFKAGSGNMDEDEFRRFINELQRRASGQMENRYRRPRSAAELEALLNPEGSPLSGRTEVIDTG